MNRELPWVDVEPIAAGEFADLRREVILRGAKWDPQIGDTSTIGRAPIVLRRSAWDELVRLSSSLASELRTIEQALLGDPASLRALGLDRNTSRWVQSAMSSPSIRLERFDFHFTDEGWKISEVNADVPGGLHEGVVGELYARHHPGTEVPGDPAAAIARAFASRCATGSAIALVHATAYADDRQVISLVQRALEDQGLVGIPCGPDHVRFAPARIALGPRERPIAGVYRFFPAEWLEGLPRDTQPRAHACPDVVVCNPVSALAVQSKRLPLVWGCLGLDVPTFRALLPETRALHRAPLHRGDEWLVKPAFGRVGGGIVSHGTSEPGDFRRTLLDALLHPGDYVAQRRFRPVPWRSEGEPRTVCIGVFTLDGVVVGAYGRSTSRPFVDHLAIDSPVLVQCLEPTSP